ncbi:hypothetical protein LTR17_017937 [Elasticomyces elasticus]|nr:hypothetical protein LTR17_017937 [Elasticomyces elasticus]
MKLSKGETALITGGATGIGLALALELAQRGMNIIIASTNKQNLDASAGTIKAAGASDVLAIICDVADRASVENLHNEAVAKFGFVDLVVSNAGVTTSGPLVDHRPQDWSWVYDVVLHGTTYIIQSFYPDMVKRKSGHIVLIGSQAGVAVDWVKQHGPYTSAKAAVMALGTALRPEAAEHGVGVTNVIVAGTQTEIMKSERSRPERYGGELKHCVERRPARRIPTKDVAEMIVRGVEEDRPWVATHPDLKGTTESYFKQILDSYDQWK